MRRKEEKEKKRVESIRTRFIVEDFSEGERRYQAILAYCKHFNTTFHDGEFPHKTDIILRKTSLLEKLKKLREPKLEWIRPVVAFPLPVFDFTRTGIRHAERYDPWILLDDPQTSDVHQTGIGDCSLISALSVIAEQPAILNRIFPRTEVSEYGVYEIRLCDSGEWKSYLVDDWLLARGDKVATAQTDNHQLWVSLIEKAIAKIHGGYMKIRGINILESFTLLTGFPAHQFTVSRFTEDEVWEMLISARTAGDLMTAGNRKKIPKNDAVSLSRWHAYSILDVKMFEGHRLIRLRDPRGLQMRREKWGQLWSGWDEYGIRKMLELHGSVKKMVVWGEFWLGFDDFMKYFDSQTDVLLESGDYVVMATKFRTRKAERNIVIHSSTPLDAHLIPLNPTVMVDCVQKFIRKSGRPVKLNIPSASIQKYWFSNEVLMILAENRSKNQYLHVNIYYQRHEFDYCSTRPQFFDSQEDTIPPMSRQIILILTPRKLEKIDLGIDLEYSMDSEQFGKYGRRNKRSHIPDLVPYDYIHDVLAIDNCDSDNE